MNKTITEYIVITICNNAVAKEALVREWESVASVMAHHKYHKVFLLVLNKENILSAADPNYINYSKKSKGSRREII